EYGHHINKDLKNEKPEDFLDALRVVIKCICFPEKYFAKVLRQSIDKLGTDEEGLLRVVVSRAEVDMKHIKEQYFKRTSKSLGHAIAADTSGDYQDFLLTLIGKD
ncbi:annexin, partial [Acinetobacter baumannii]|uniref:annexin n=1 Tax=Acinetobacter baumannii TaxID=470 RepID=UPI000D4860E2